jgi:carboxyl-terminal processing protease
VKRTLATVGAIALLAGACVTVLGAQARLAVETFDRAWTIVRDTHFDKTLNGVDWEAVRTELRPRAATAASDSQLRTVIRDMLGRLGQSHFALIPSTADSTTGDRGDLSAGPGFQVRLLDRDLVVSAVDAASAAARASVRPGWMVASIDGRNVRQMLDALPETMPQRLLAVEAWRIAETRLRGPQGSTVRVDFIDGAAKTVSLGLERAPDLGEPVKVGNLPTMFVRVTAEERRTPGGATAGVIGFNVWMPAVDPEFQKAVDRFRKADGIVLDLRGNPGGLAAMLMGISGHFVAERKSLGVMKTRDSELRFFANPRMVSAAGERVEPFAGPVAILVDAMTGSASECFAGGMQSIKRARVFGQTSMGQALPAVFDKLPNGDVLIHAYADFVTADGTRLEGRGVVPDVEVPLSREDLLAGKDAAMDRALQWVEESARGR